MVYYLSADEGEIHSYGMKALDGDLKKIRPADLTPDGGIEVRPTYGKAGRPFEIEHVPTRIRLEGPKRDLTDLRADFGLFVDGKVRTEVEKLEAGVHQFFPVTFFWEDGSHAADRFWFVPCNRLDSVDRKETTFAFKGIWYLDGSTDKKLVFNRAQIGSHHAWIDKFITPMSGVWISNALKKGLEEAGVTGMSLRVYAEV
jgi:hypothetical protein